MIESIQGRSVEGVNLYPVEVNKIDSGAVAPTTIPRYFTTFRYGTF
ncbi:MAG: hypothetical protein UHM08_04095 [Bacteroidales bacterium]|nr:hypothetical protein [Bacteroidales bacterium]